MTNNAPQNPFDADYFRCELQAALMQPALGAFDNTGEPDDSARRAAYQLALALGQCRLFGIEPGEELDGTLPAKVAWAACRELRTYLAEWSEECSTLETRWLQANAVETDSLCAELLEARMEAWAVYLAVDEAACAASDDGSLGGEEAQELFEQTGAAAAAMAAFDDRLYEQRSLLSVLVALPLLDNWRLLLAEEFRHMLPWWLDGTLAEEAAYVAEKAAAVLPGPTAWRQMRGAIQPVVTPGRGLPVSDLPAAIQWDLAADEPPLLGEHVSTYRWTSPDGCYEARLFVPAPDRVTRGQAEPVTLAVLVADGHEAGELQGSTVWLGTVEAKLDDRGRAIFALGELLVAGNATVERILPLAVGNPSVVWQFCSEN